MWPVLWNFPTKELFGPENTALSKLKFCTGILISYQIQNNSGQNMSSKNNMKKDYSTSRCYARKIPNSLAVPLCVNNVVQCVYSLDQKGRKRDNPEV